MADKIDFSLTSYILGIVSIVTGVLASPLLGLAFGIIGLVQSNKQKTKVSKSAKTLNIIGIIASVVIFAITLFIVSRAGDILPSIPSA